MRNLKELKKVKSIEELKRCGLPIPETIFIFDFEKQEKEIDDFLVNKRIVTIRSDKENQTDFCPHRLRCERNNLKSFVKQLNATGYVAILQRYVPIRRDRVSGNILILKNRVLVELMGTGPLTALNRDGKVLEQITLDKSLKEINHFGVRLISRKEITGILKKIKNFPLYKILEFTLRPERVYFWQIRDDQSAKSLEK
ncbi:MAG: hypothetical protein HY443_01455 [Candidatus Nealsonbacteria bacterium]|nr:hypothetical protein [Candidatus Nealsonbacteria bacterium]